MLDSMQPCNCFHSIENLTWYKELTQNAVSQSAKATDNDKIDNL